MKLQVFLSTAMVFAGFAAVSGTAQASARGPKTLTIASIVGQVTDPFFITMRCGEEAAAKKFKNVNVAWQGPTSSSTPAEVAAFDSEAVLKPNGVIVDPFSPTAFLAPITALMRKGTPAYTVDGMLAKKVAYGETTTDSALSATSLANSIGTMMGGKGELAIIAFGPTNIVDVARYQPMIPILEAKYPNITVLPIQYSPSDETTAAQITAGLLVAHPGLSAIYGTDGPNAEGAAAALQTAGKTSSIPVIAFDAEPAIVQGLMSGKFYAIYSQDPYLEGYTAVTRLVHYLRGPKGHAKIVRPDRPYYVPTPLMFLTKANIGTPAAKPFIYSASSSC
jgi:ribose transport system substrate-binding protein